MIRTTSPILAGLCFLMFGLSSVPNMGSLYNTNEINSQDETKLQDEESKVNSQEKFKIELDKDD